MTMILTGVRVWDGHSDALPDSLRSIRIERGKITSIDAATGLSGVDADEGVVDLEGRCAIPGLIDAHVHLDLDPGLMSPDDQFKVSVEDRCLRMIARADAMVTAGITTARDLGAGEWHELRLRDAIQAGGLRGPRLICAGQPITIPAGHCYFWGGAAKGEAEHAAVLARQLEHGVDCIKVMATGGVFTKGSGVTKAQFSQAEIEKIVGLANAADRHVAAHCHGAEGIRNAAKGGVRTIEHCSFAGSSGFGSAFDPAVVDAVAASGAYVSPTVNAGWARRIEKDGVSTPFFRRMTHVLDMLRAAGVPMIASTDAGIPGVFHHHLPKALSAFARFASFTPVETLRAATSASARALGLEARCGALQPGLSADIVVLDANPLEDLAHLEAPHWVSARGRIVASKA
jgi:imidazolonepropionase-like amidohydrolase